MLEACNALRDCWDPDAFVMDRQAGVFIDPAKARFANYAGSHVRMRGSLTIPRTPQGRPVFLRAGACDRGRDFAARWAEMISCTPHSNADAIASHDDIKSRMGQYGRTPDQCTMLPSFAVAAPRPRGLLVGTAQSIADELEHYADPAKYGSSNSRASGGWGHWPQTPFPDESRRRSLSRI